MDLFISKPYTESATIFITIYIQKYNYIWMMFKMFVHLASASGHAVLLLRDLQVTSPQTATFFKSYITKHKQTVRKLCNQSENILK